MLSVTNRQRGYDTGGHNGMISLIIMSIIALEAVKSRLLVKYLMFLFYFFLYLHSRTTGWQSVSNGEMLKTGNSHSRHLQVGSDFKNKHISRDTRQNVLRVWKMRVLKKRLKPKKCFKTSYNNPKPQLSFSNTNKGRNALNRLKNQLICTTPKASTDMVIKKYPYWELHRRQTR
jgi:hypothetical protein